MSGFLGIGAANLASVLLRRPRRIGIMVPNVVLEEVELDEIEITDHPVETGAPIADHAYRKPSELIMRLGWSNSAALRIAGIALPFASQGLVTAVTSLGERDYITETYKELIDLQRSLEPFEVVTGKRVHRNMLIRSISATTDGTTENVLMAQVRMREVLIVEAAARTVPPTSQQRDPASTAGVESTGPASTRPTQLPQGAGE
jgi:hypothetical protein